MAKHTKQTAQLRTRAKTRTRTTSTTNKPEACRGWSWDHGDRGKLTAVEEMDIAAQPRPEKTPLQEATENETRSARTDPDAEADLYPMAISGSRGGIPAFRPDMLARLTGERPLTVPEQRWALRLAEWQLIEPVCYHLLTQRYLDNRSDRTIARSLGISPPTVATMLLHAQLAILREYIALFERYPAEG